jgi:hypothetical protein
MSINSLLSLIMWSKAIEVTLHVRLRPNVTPRLKSFWISSPEFVLVATWVLKQAHQSRKPHKNRTTPWGRVRKSGLVLNSAKWE